MRSLATFIAANFSSVAVAALVTIGPDGIDSKDLPLNQTEILTGKDILIGQLEDGRPGKPNNLDQDPESYATDVKPTEVRRPDGQTDTPDSFWITDHATGVAGTMIGDPGTWQGVAPMAKLYSIAAGSADQLGVARHLNRLATMQQGNIRAINMSFSLQFDDFIQPGGNSHMTKFIDWSARQHEVLYVGAWGNSTDVFLPRSPADMFNGIVVGASRKPVDGPDAWVQTGGINAEEGLHDHQDNQEIDILAPGEQVPLHVTNNREVVTDGTSFATPHVTGTAALMMEYAQYQSGQGNQRFNSNALRHNVLKALLMNSADKIQGVQGANHSVIDQAENGWEQSEAWENLFTPLDDEMGAGLLNARRAIKNLSPGEYSPGPVEKIGWDYGTVGGQGSSNDYFIEGTVSAGDYVAITLTWDRIITNSGGSTYNEGDQFTISALPNLDVWLIPQNTDDFGLIADASISFDGNVEHIFWKIGAGFTGEYKIKVLHSAGGEGSAQSSVNYGLAWWIGSGGSGPPGDYDGNGSVGPEDYDIWKANFGTPFAAADGNGNGVVDAADYTVWRDNFGTGSGSIAAVPEPSTAWLLVAAVIAGVGGSDVRK